MTTLASNYSASTAALDVASIAQVAENAINAAIEDQDPAALLKWYDDKGILSIACKAKGCGKGKFEQWIVRALLNDTASALSDAIRNQLPHVTAA